MTGLDEASSDLPSLSSFIFSFTIRVCCNRLTRILCKKIADTVPRPVSPLGDFEGHLTMTLLTRNFWLALSSTESGIEQHQCNWQMTEILQLYRNGCHCKLRLTACFFVDLGLLISILRLWSKARGRVYITPGTSIHHKTACRCHGIGFPSQPVCLISIHCRRVCFCEVTCS